MYPNLYAAFKDWFGVEWCALKLVNTFGFFIAISFFCAAYILTKELKRKEALGWLGYKEVKVQVGKPEFNLFDWGINALLGFVIGMKFVGAMGMDCDALNDTQAYIASKQGSVPGGILVALVFLGLRWVDYNKEKKKAPQIITEKFWAHQRVGDIVMLAIVFGFLGAKLFHNLENLDEFTKDPMGALVSFSGLTFYGGLICAALAIYVWSRRVKIPFVHLCDATAPGLMLAYCTGRMGCHFSGDGDWGILNTAYKTDLATGKSMLAGAGDYAQALATNGDYYLRHFGGADKVPHAAFAGPSWLPDWLFGYAYPHNVLSEGAKLTGCDGAVHCSALPVPVFPTPMYEVVMAGLIFAFLWAIRKRITTPGKLFGIYLIANGIERFVIEKIRVNTTYNLPFNPTQAEIISTLLVVGGIALLLLMKPKKDAATIAATTETSST
jgi:phosphatidylglycerol---prolipoprotein diacylglyceryl transferase